MEAQQYTENFGQKLTRLARQARKEKERERNNRYAKRVLLLTENKQYLDTFNDLIQKMKADMEQKASDDKYKHIERFQMYDIFPRDQFPENFYRDQLTYKVMTDNIMREFNNEFVKVEHTPHLKQLTFTWNN